MILDAADDHHPVVAVNDTRTEKEGTVTVKDLNTNEVLFSDKFSIPYNGKTIVGHIPHNDKQSMWLIEYTIGNEKFTNHYLAGKAPFKLKDYEDWYRKIGIGSWVLNGKYFYPYRVHPSFFCTFAKK